MTDSQGWLGHIDQLDHALRTFGADADEDDKILVRGNVSFFLGIGPDVLVDGKAECRIKGEWTRIAPLMAQTSYGIRGVTVI